MNTYVIAFGITTAWLVGTEAFDPPIQPGVAYVFFNQSTFQRPADSGIQSDIRMETKGVDFGWLWLGKHRFPQAAEVTFSAEADDGLRLLRVGDALVIDGPSVGGSREGKLRVAAGQTLPLWLEYYQRGGGAHLRLFWQWQDHPRLALVAR